MKLSITGEDLNLPQVDWKGVADHGSVTQAFINRLVQENGYTQVVDTPMVQENRYTRVVDTPTRGNSLLDIYLI